MNAIINHLGFSLIETKGIELEEEIVSGELEVYSSGYSLTLYTQKFGQTTYNSVVCLPLEIKVVNYNLIVNNQNLIKNIFCNFKVNNIEETGQYNIQVDMTPSYSASNKIHLEVEVDAKITYLVLPEKFHIACEGISCSTYLYL